MSRKKDLENKKAIEVDEGDSRPLTVEERDKIIAAYSAQALRNKALLEEIVFILEQKLSDSGIKIHEIEHRIKQIDSVLDKCERKGIQDHNLLSDIVAARVVCLFRSDMTLVAEILKANFEIIKIDDKLSDGGPLGYQSTHFVCKLPSRYTGPRYENTAGVEFEIQVRTLCMHAWAAVSHHLDYKGDWDVPEELKRALSALGGLFYVADNQFEQFYSARAQSKTDAEEKIGPENDQELNLDTVTSYLKQKFSDRVQSSTTDISKLVRELKSNGYRTIQDIDKMVSRGEDAFRKYEESHPPRSGRFFSTGVVRVTDRIVNRRRSGIRNQVEAVLHLVKPE